MAGLDPATHHSPLERVIWRLDTRRMVGRLKGGHDEGVSGVNSQP